MRSPPRFMVLVLGLLLLAGYESWLRPKRLKSGLATSTARWIWSAHTQVPAASRENWVSFFAFDDFELERASAPSELRIQADEGYWVFLNGVAVGSGGFREDAPLDSYDVSDLLKPGANRIVVQLRSRRGTGGLIASLEVEGVPAVVSDSAWRTTERYSSALMQPHHVPDDVAAVVVWGSPPVGRWDVPKMVSSVPRLEQQLNEGSPRQAFRIRAFGRSEWERNYPAIERRVPLGKWVTFDLGEATAGYLNVAFAGRGGAFGLIYSSLERPSGVETEDPSGHFVAPAGRGSWTDLAPRRFRYVTVLSSAEIAGLRVFKTGAELVERRAADPHARSTAFGIAPPSRPSIEDEFWSKLERLTGFRGREAFESFPSG